MDARPRRRVAVAMGVTTLALVMATVSWYPPSGALGETLSQDPVNPDDLTAPSDTTDLTAPLPGELRDVLDQTTATVGGTLGDLTGGDDPESTTTTVPTTTTSTTPPPDPDPVSKEHEPATTTAPSGTSSDQGPDDASRDADVPPSVWARLESVRDLAGGEYVLPMMTMANVLPNPFEGFVDIPAGPRSTREIVDLLLSAGATPEDLARILTPFPVAGPARYSNDWGAPRHSPAPHAHQGTDIFSPRGTPVIASFDGIVSNVGSDTAVGGNSVRVTQPDGTYSYYAHLDGFAPAAVEGAPVRAGTEIGSVGTTGNASGTPPHLHYEIHPGGGEAVPPLPYLDAWLEAARTRAVDFAESQGLSNVVVPDVISVPAQSPVPVTPFVPAAATSESPIPGLAMLMGIGVTVVMIRRRHRLPRRLLGVFARVGGVFPKRHRVPVPSRFIVFPFERMAPRGEADEGRVVDVLEPFLRERVGATR